MQEKVSVNTMLCKKTGNVLQGLQLRREFYRRPFLSMTVPAETRLRAFFYSVAICHQTYNLHHPGLSLYGWDYLERVFTQLMQDNDPLLQPGFSKASGIDDICRRLASLFSADGNPDHTTLDRLDERAQFMIDLDVFVDDFFESRIENLIETADNELIHSGTGFYEILPGLIAFSDPMKKKVTFLLKLLEEAGMVNIRDKQNFTPIMDYHMQRVLLRTGCVEIPDEDLHHKLSDHKPIQSDEEVRNACIDAFKLIADVSGHPVTKLNDFFWSLGRSCCNNEPLCRVGRCEKDPCTFYEIVELTDHRECILKDVCKGFRDDHYRNLWQPVVETHYY